jgi:hypothetical protein
MIAKAVDRLRGIGQAGKGAEQPAMRAAAPTTPTRGKTRHSPSEHAAAMAPRTGSTLQRRAANSDRPSAAKAPAFSQHISGRFSIYGTPLKAGTIQSRLASISRAISAHMPSSGS